MQVTQHFEDLKEIHNALRGAEANTKTPTPHPPPPPPEVGNYLLCLRNSEGSCVSKDIGGGGEKRVKHKKGRGASRL